MPDGNSLVAQPKDTTTAVTGIGIAESAQGLAHGVSNGDWVEAGLSAAGVGLEVLSMVIDPLGTLASYGVSWLIEHVRPLKEALDWFAGDPPVIRSFSETWANVAREVNAVATDLTNEANAGTSGWTGTAADTYRGHSAETADAIAGAATLADGISAGVMIMGEVVAFVREFIRDMVGELVGRLISWALEEVATLGLATPLVVAQATSAIAKVVNKISDLVRKLVKTIGNVAPRIKKVISKLDEIIAKLAKLMRKGGGDSTPSAASSAGRHTDTSPSAAPDGSPSSTATSSSSTSTSPSSAEPSSTPSGTGTSPARADGTGTTYPDTSGSTTTAARRSDTAAPSGARPGSLRSKLSSAKNGARDFAVRAKEKIGRALGDPVDMVSGEVLLTQEDVHLAGVLPLVLERVHLSNYRSGTWFGPSWASTVDQRVEVTADGVCFASADGVILFYPRCADGFADLPTEGPRWSLSGSASGGFTISDPVAGRSLRFAAANPVTPSVLPLVETVDRNGNAIVFRYDDDGTLTGIDHSGGYRVRVDVRGHRIIALSLVGAGVDASDVTLKRYAYDDAGNLAEVVNSSKQPMRFVYDSAHRMTRWQDRRGTWYEFTYDDQGRCVRGTGADGMLNSTFTYDTKNRVTAHTNSLGHTTTFHYNSHGQVLRRVDPLGNATRSEFDRYDRLLATIDPLGNTTRYVSDDAGNLVELIHPTGSRTAARYNDFGQPVEIAEPNGSIWRRAYDERGNLTEVVDPSGTVVRLDHDRRGHLLAITGSLGQVRRFETNAAGLPVAATDALGATTHYIYDAFGRVTSVTDALGMVVRFGWTIEGHPAWVRWPDGTIQQRSYDAEECLIEQVDAAGEVNRTEYTHFDLESAVVRPDGARVQFVHDTELRVAAVVNQEGLTWRYEYDPAGNLVRETDFNGRVLSYRRDAAGRVIERINGTGESTHYRYDQVGNIVEQRSGTDVATFGYDSLARVVRATNADADVTLTYDPVGRVVAETSNGYTVTSAYDTAGRRLVRRTPSGRESVWQYDAAGRPTALHTADHLLTFDHDPVGREVRRQIGSVTLAQAWDAGHRVNAQVLTVADASSPRTPRIVQRRNYTYRADGAVTAVSDALVGSRAYDLDPTGRAVRVVFGDGDERYSYDLAGNITSSTAGPPETVGTRRYDGTRLVQAGATRLDHDVQGRLIRRRSRTLSGRVLEWHYEWDATDRLRSVTTPGGGRCQYRYDALGRRVAKEQLAPDGSTVLRRTTFIWDDLTLAEEITSTHESAPRTTGWDWHPDDDWRPLTQIEHEPNGPRLQAILTDPVGTPTELATPTGKITWRATGPLWGVMGGDGASYTPLRFPGQYHDRETGLNYNLNRYYDPALSRYLSADPINLHGGTGIHSYVPNPLTWIDPLGLQGYRRSRDPQPTYAWTKRGDQFHTQTSSAYTPQPGINQPSFWDMRAYHNQIGHPLVSGGLKDQSRFGQHFAMHAERQAAYLDPNQTVYVSPNTVCTDCRGFFQAVANYHGQPQRVIDDHNIYQFTPNHAEPTITPSTSGP